MQFRKDEAKRPARSFYRAAAQKQPWLLHWDSMGRWGGFFSAEDNPHPHVSFGPKFPRQKIFTGFYTVVAEHGLKCAMPEVKSLGCRTLGTASSSCILR